MVSEINFASVEFLGCGNFGFVVKVFCGSQPLCVIKNARKEVPVAWSCLVNEVSRLIF